MTNPAGYQQPTAQRPWVQQPGGYDPSGQQQPQQQQFVPQQQQQAPQQGLPPLLQQQQQPQLGLPPQMQSPLQQIDGGSPLAQMQPIAPPMQQRQFQPQQQAPQQQFQPQQPVPQQQQFQQPQQQQQSPVLSGPGVPQELQGRTLAEAISIYNGMRQTHLQNMQQPAPQMQQPAPQRQQQVQPAQPGQSAQFDWRNPGQSVAAVVDERINAAIDSKLMPMLAPLAARNAMGDVERARQQAAASIGQQTWVTIEADVLQLLQGADPQTLTNPNAWALAAQTAVGRRALAGQRPQQQYQQQQPGAYPVQQVQQQQNPLPNLNGFWSEPSNQGGPMNMGVQLTPQQLQAADAMGITHADYAAWSVGLGGQRR